MKCVVTTSLLMWTGAISCFISELSDSLMTTVHRVSCKQLGRYENRCHMTHKLHHLAISVLEGAMPSIQHGRRFGRFLTLQWWNLNSLSSVNQMKFTTEAGQQHGDWHQRLRRATLLSLHISWRQCYVTTGKIFNKQANFVKIFWISILSGTAAKILRKCIVIRWSYERKKGVPFLLKHSVHKFTFYLLPYLEAFIVDGEHVYKGDDTH